MGSSLTLQEEKVQCLRLPAGMQGAMERFEIKVRREIKRQQPNSSQPRLASHHLGRNFCTSRSSSQGASRDVPPGKDMLAKSCPESFGCPRVTVVVPQLLIPNWTEYSAFTRSASLSSPQQQLVDWDFSPSVLVPLSPLTWIQKASG